MLFDPGAVPSVAQDREHLRVCLVINGVVLLLAAVVIPGFSSIFEGALPRATLPLWVVGPVVGLAMTVRARLQLARVGALARRSRRRQFYGAVLPALLPPLATLVAILIDVFG